MKSIVCCVVVAFFYSGSIAQTISLPQLQKLYGYWNGTLTYLDYSSNKPFTMPASLAIYPLKNALVIRTSYPDEPQANNADTISINDGDTVFMGSRITSFSMDSTGDFEIITITAGKDGNENKDALIRKKYSVQKGKYKVQKEIQFTGTPTWFTRHTYQFRKTDNTNLAAFTGTWTIDLRPGIAAAPYLQSVKFVVDGKRLSGIFYGLPFTDGFINTEWNRISFGFTTSDKTGEYVHTGFYEDGKLTGFSFSKNRGVIIPWFSVKKE